MKQDILDYLLFFNWAYVNATNATPVASGSAVDGNSQDHNCHVIALLFSAKCNTMQRTKSVALLHGPVHGPCCEAADQCANALTETSSSLTIEITKI